MKLNISLSIRVLFIGLIYTSFSPWFFWFLGGKIYLLLSLLIVVFLTNKKTNINNLLFFATLYVLGFFLYISLDYNLQVIPILALSSALFFLLNKSDVVHISKLFKISLALICLPGLILWGIHLISGDLNIAKLGTVPLNFVPVVKAQAGYEYIIYPFSLRLNSTIEQLYYPGLYRFQSLFDEPGFLGTICALYLASERRENFNKYSFVILVSGIASFSLAFYIIYFTYIFLSRFHNIKSLIYSLFIASLIMIPLVVYTDLLDVYILSRLDITDTGISGDNRSTSSIDKYFSAWWEAEKISDFMLGINYNNEGSSTWKLIFIRGGIIAPFLLACYYALAVLYFMRSKRLNLQFFIFLLVFMLSAYQRIPYINTVYLFIFINAVINLLPPSNNRLPPVPNKPPENS